MKKRMVASVSVLLVVVLVLAASNAGADTPVKFKWQVSNSFIQGGTDVPQTGARAQADNGDFVRITGRGRFNSSTGSVSGGGVFVHTDSAGVVVGFGRWVATGVRSFELFGCGVAGDGTELPPNFCGGVLTLNIHINGINVTAGAGALDGVLAITCLIGDAPEDIPAGAEEGITLDIPGAINFDDLVPELGGLTLFVSTK